MKKKALNSTDEISTAEELLKVLRSGHKESLELQIGTFSYPVRLLNAQDEAVIIVKAKMTARKNNPKGIDLELFESLECMREILRAATSFEENFFPVGFLESLSTNELTELYNRYQTLCKTINPEFESMNQAELLELIAEVQKKNRKVSSLYTWQLAGIGKYCLEVIIPVLQTASAHGSK